MAYEETAFLERNRFCNLIDGAYAIAMTLLIFGIALPSNVIVPTGTDWQSIVDDMEMFPKFLDYLWSFLILAFFWIAHNYLFRHVGKIDIRYTWLNMCSLFFVVLIPFTTVICTRYGGVFAAELFFHINILCLVVINYLLLRYVDQHRELVKTGTNETINFEDGRKLNTALFIIVLVGLALTFWIPEWSNIVYVSMPLLSLWIHQKK